MKKIGVFLLFVFLIDLLCNAAILSLESYSVFYVETRTVTFQYVIYAFVGVVFETPSPFWAYLIANKICDKDSIKSSIKKIFSKRNTKITILTILIVSISIFIFGILNGKPNGSPFFLMFLSVPVLIIGGGIEEVGWRGLLQPELEKKLPYPLATLITSLIWWSWHLTLWLQPSSNHYGDSLVGFLIMIITWSFLLSIVYKVTKCTFACVLVHSVVNSVGAVYDWNDLFDHFPTRPVNILCYAATIIFSIIMWYIVDKKDKVKKENSYNGLSKSW